MAILALVIFGVSMLMTIVFVILCGVTVVKGVLRSRFSLRTLMITVLSGGACATMLMDRHESVLIAGAACSTIYVTAIVSYLLSVGGAPKNVVSKAPEHRGTV